MRRSMPKYEMNDAAIDLHANFTDKTIYLLTVETAGSSSFTFVVSSFGHHKMADVFNGMQSRAAQEQADLLQQLGAH